MADRDLRRRALPTARPSIEAVATATAIVDFLAESETPVGVQGIADVLGITKSRVSRHVANLESLGLVARVDGSRGFRLGWRVTRWGQIAAVRMNLPGRFDGVLRDLNASVGRTVLLSEVAGGDAIVVRCLPAPGAIRIEVALGLVLSLPQSPTARVCFAFQTRERRRELLVHARQRDPAFRIDDEVAFDTAIAAIQERHFAWDYNKFDLGHGAVSAPVFDRSGGIVAAVTVMVPTADLVNGPERTLVSRLIDCSEACARVLGSRHCYPRPA